MFWIYLPNDVCNDYLFKIDSDQLDSNGIIEEQFVYNKIMSVLFFQFLTKENYSSNKCS